MLKINILITKIGYLNYRIYVGNSDTSGITIKLIARFGTVTDTDGNVYQTVKIGTQEWMVENLRVTKYNDGSPIPLDSSKTFVAAKTPKYCYYNNAGNTDSIIKFGALYNWFVVSPANPLKIAPSGWHVPSDTEWTILTSNTTTSSLAATADWCKPSLKYYCNDMNNSSGFSALPGGCRVYNGSFDDLGQIGYWWSVTGYDTYSAYMRYFLTGTPSGMISNASDKSCGLSVRLLRD